MRGVKIGTKREGNAGKGMSMFETTRKADAEEGQKEAEKAVKENVASEFTLD